MPDNRKCWRLSTGLIVVVFASLALSGYLLSYFHEPVSSEPVNYEPLKISLQRAGPEAGSIEQQLLALIDEVRKPESVREVEVEVRFSLLAQ